MQIHHVSTVGALVEVVDVLRDYALGQALFFKKRDHVVRIIGFG